MREKTHLDPLVMSITASVALSCDDVFADRRYIWRYHPACQSEPNSLDNQTERISSDSFLDPGDHDEILLRSIRPDPRRILRDG